MFDSCCACAITLDDVVFFSSHSNEYQKPALTAISAAPQKQWLQVKGQRSGPGQNHWRLTLTSNGSCDRVLFQPGTLDIMIWRAGRDIEENKPRETLLGREMEERN